MGKLTPWPSSWDAPYCSWMVCWNSGSVQWKRTSALSLAISRHFIWARPASPRLALTPRSLCWNGSIQSIHTKQTETHLGGMFLKRRDPTVTAEARPLHTFSGWLLYRGVKFRGVNGNLVFSITPSSQITPDCLSKQSLLASIYNHHFIVNTAFLAVALSSLGSWRLYFRTGQSCE